MANANSEPQSDLTEVERRLANEIYALPERNLGLSPVEAAELTARIEQKLADSTAGKEAATHQVLADQSASAAADMAPHGADEEPGLDDVTGADELEAPTNEESGKARAAERKAAKADKK